MPARKRGRRKTAVRRGVLQISKTDAKKLRTAISELSVEAARMMKRIRAAKKAAGRKR